MSSDFTQTFAQSTGFLTSGVGGVTGAPMVKITALQVLQDQSNVNNDLMAVFGTDAAGNPLVGYVDMLTTADPLLPIGPWAVSKVHL